MNPNELPAIWSACVDKLKDRVNNRSFWEALERTQVVTIDGNLLVIGILPEESQYIAHLQQSVYANTIRQAVNDTFGQPLELRVIEGVSLSDWKSQQERDLRVSTLREAASVQRTTESSDGDSWDSLMEQVSRLYAETPLRVLPQVRARYANEALHRVAEAMDTLYSDVPSEATERSVARIIERIAHNADIPPSVVAFELDRLCAWRKSAE